MMAVPYTQFSVSLYPSFFSLKSGGHSQAPHRAMKPGLLLYSCLEIIFAGYFVTVYYDSESQVRLRDLLRKFSVYL